MSEPTYTATDTSFAPGHGAGNKHVLKSWQTPTLERLSILETKLNTNGVLPVETHSGTVGGDFGPAT